MCPWLCGEVERRRGAGGRNGLHLFGVLDPLVLNLGVQGFPSKKQRTPAGSKLAWLNEPASDTALIIDAGPT
jgi:hypothetical protein